MRSRTGWRQTDKLVLSEADGYIRHYGVGVRVGVAVAVAATGCGVGVSVSVGVGVAVAVAAATVGVRVRVLVGAVVGVCVLVGATVGAVVLVSDGVNVKVGGAVVGVGGFTVLMTMGVKVGGLLIVGCAMVGCGCGVGCAVAGGISVLKTNGDGEI